MKKYSWCKLILKLLLLCKQATPSAAKNVNNKTGPLTTGPLTTCTKQTTLFGPNGLFKFTAGSKADSKPGFKIFQDPVEAKKPEKIENPPEHFRSVQVQTKLSAHPRDSSAGKSVDWTFALDEEAQKLKDLADSRAKELEIHLKENEILKIRQAVIHS